MKELKEFMEKKIGQLNDLFEANEYEDVIAMEGLPGEERYATSINNLIELSNITISAGNKESEVNVQDLVKLAFVLGELYTFCAKEMKDVSANAIKEHLKSAKHLL